MRARRTILSIALSASVAALALVPSGASAQRGIDIGFGDQIFANVPADGAAWQHRAARQARSDITRIHLSWGSLLRFSGVRPTNPENHLDMGYDFSALDYAVRNARSRGQNVLISIDTAPAFARSTNPGQDCGKQGQIDGRFAQACLPKPAEFGLLGRALATRYNGQTPNIPRVRFFQAWNEPNLPGFLMPQRANYDRGALRSPKHYVRMLNAFYGNVKRAQRSAQVVTAGTAPFGSDAGDGNPRLRPLEFWRGVFCLRPNLKQAKGCPPKPRFDIIAHHPISVGTSPHRSARHRDDMVFPDIKRLRRTLRAAQQRNRIAGQRKRGHQIWVDEFWWQTKPPQRGRCAVPQRKHAKFIAEGLYLLWKQGVRAAINLQIVDSPYDRSNDCATGQNMQTGVFRANGRAKPGLRAMRFPFVTEKRGNRLIAWGKAPNRGRVVIQQRRGKRWVRATRTNAGKNRVFRTQIRTGGRPTMRAKRGKQTSFPWRPR